MKQPFGATPDGREATLYTIKAGKLTAQVTDFGATLVSLLMPDRNGNIEDIVLGYPSVEAYAADQSCMGATVGRNANRIAGASFYINDQKVTLNANDSGNSLHSLPNGYSHRLWCVQEHKDSYITFRLESPHRDQGFPGNAIVNVTYQLDASGILSIRYDAVCDRDTVFNLTNHSFFNLAGHQHTAKALRQELILPAQRFLPTDEHYLPTGELLPVDGTPMDFRKGRIIAEAMDLQYPYLKRTGGYDNTFEVISEPCAILRDPDSCRTLLVVTDCPGVHFYSGNFLDGTIGKDGVSYTERSGICLETHFFPNAVHNPHWKQPIVRAGIPYHSETKYIFR